MGEHANLYLLQDTNSYIFVSSDWDVLKIKMLEERCGSVEECLTRD